MLSFLKSHTIFIGVILVCVVVISVMYSTLSKQKATINSLSYDVMVLEGTVVSLEHTLDNIKQLRQIENAELERSREKFENLESANNKNINRVEEVYKNGEAVDSLLPDDISRLLNEACAEVRGSPCPPP